MEKRNLQISLGIIVLMLIVGGGLFYRNANTQNPASASATTTPTNTEDSLEDLVNSGRATVTVGTTDVVAAPTKKAPSLDYQLHISADLSANAVAAVKTQVASLSAKIKADQKDFDSWVQFGVLAKVAGDYSRALELWSYASYLVGGSPVPYANSGDIYANYLKDYPKAETNYKKAIANTPTNPAYYTELFNLYNYSYHPAATAGEDILKQGIKANPDAFDLQVLLARYYKSAGRSADAKTQFDAAVANATRQGKTDTATQIKTESTQ